MSKKLTGLFGAPVGDRENSMTAGPRGPLLMQDIYHPLLYRLLVYF